jgi:hypothetical protein
MVENQPVKNAEIIPLAFHVDYWDRLGWKDPFSSPIYTQRQENYAQRFQIDSAYTPQMIVDGQAQFVGSQQGKANNEIDEAARRIKGKIDAAFSDGVIKVAISELPEHKDSTVFLAVTEAGLSTNVSRGENSGQTLTHPPVVRELRSVGAVPASDAGAEMSAQIAVDQSWNAERLSFVIFVQDNISRKILAAALTSK